MEMKEKIDVETKKYVSLATCRSETLVFFSSISSGIFLQFSVEDRAPVMRGYYG